MIHALSSFKAKAFIAGFDRDVSWDGDSLVISGVNSFSALVDVLSIFAGVPQVAEINREALERMGSKTLFTNVSGLTGGVQPQNPADHGTPKESPKQDTKPAEIAKKPEPTPKKTTVAAPKADLPAAKINGENNSTAVPKDLEPFARFTQLKQIIRELFGRGNADYSSILSECKRIQGLKVSPVLNRSVELESNIKVCCTALEIPGTPAE